MKTATIYNPILDLQLHGLHAAYNAEGKIVTVNEYTDCDRVYRAVPVTLNPTRKSIREFLGY